MTRSRVTGVVLAAGEGRRMGMPKALVDTGDGTSWLTRTVREVQAGGCSEVLVVVGAEATRVQASYAGPPVTFAVSEHWERGMAASLRTALETLAAAEDPADAALIMLVDLPDVGADVVRRVVEHAGSPECAEDCVSVLARASYDGRLGHPVLVGRAHWPAMAATSSGDEGGRRYLAAHGAVLIECGDLATGRDQDTPPGTSGPE